jgi:hypothetical protein
VTLFPELGCPEGKSGEEKSVQSEMAIRLSGFSSIIKLMGRS